MSDFESIGDALRRRPPFQHTTQQGRRGDEVVTLHTKGGATIWMTAQEAADAGVRCVGEGAARLCQFGVFKDDHGEWVYPPWHAADDLDGSQYRREYDERVERRYHAIKKQRQRPRQETPMRGFS